ncbi:putative signal peptide protein [Puccinia sorghi]|uniref:Putative signal peptide protein n=1 Tax=Puccinia sorghi TaxID=27349 RepID=A0A0L6VHR1_9BASI|nr:putative signal peptide protein [Puccinia sorghi]
MCVCFSSIYSIPLFFLLDDGWGWGNPCQKIDKFGCFCSHFWGCRLNFGGGGYNSGVHKFNLGLLVQLFLIGHTHKYSSSTNHANLLLYFIFDVFLIILQDLSPTRSNPEDKHMERKSKAEDQKHEQQKKQKRKDLPASGPSSNPPPKKFHAIKAVPASNQPGNLPAIPRFINKLPSQIQDHVQKLLEIESDGHCGSPDPNGFLLSEAWEKELRSSQTKHGVEFFGCAFSPWVKLCPMLFNTPSFCSPLLHPKNYFLISSLQTINPHFLCSQKLPLLGEGGIKVVFIDYFCMFCQVFHSILFEKNEKWSKWAILFSLFMYVLSCNFMCIIFLSYLFVLRLICPQKSGYLKGTAEFIIILKLGSDLGGNTMFLGCPNSVQCWVYWAQSPPQKGEALIVCFFDRNIALTYELLIISSLLTIVGRGYKCVKPMFEVVTAQQYAPGPINNHLMTGEMRLLN